MNAALIYKTTSPEAIAWWQDAQARKRQQHEARVAFSDAMLDLYGPSTRPDYSKPATEQPTPRRNLWIRGEHIIGLDSGSNERPPVGSGWRLDSKEHVWMPALTTKAGKEIAAQLDQLNTFVFTAHIKEVGISQWAFSDDYMYRPSVHFDEDEQALYQTWPSGRCEKDALQAQAGVPAIEWTAVSLSAWYAREEAKAAAKELVPA